MTESALWTGADGTNYSYKVFNTNVSWNNVPGNYIFAKLTGRGWEALYIGEAGDLKTRLVPTHEKWARALRLGMTHVHAHTSNPVKSVRTGEERNLIQRYRPPCNDRL